MHPYLCTDLSVEYLWVHHDLGSPQYNFSSYKNKKKKHANPKLGWEENKVVGHFVHPYLCTDLKVEYLWVYHDPGPLQYIFSSYKDKKKKQIPSSVSLKSLRLL